MSEPGEAASVARRLPLTVQLICALLVGLLVSGVSWSVAVEAGRSSHYLRREQESVWQILSQYRERIVHYRNAVGNYPQSLEEIHDPKAVKDIRIDATSFLPLEDSWQHPYVYSVDREKDTFSIASLGEDGKPGGEGLNYDQFLAGSPTTKGKSPLDRTMWDAAASPSLEQFESRYPDKSRSMFNAVIANGVVAAALCLVLSSQIRPGRNALPKLGIALIATTIGAIYIGAVLIELHQPSGH